MDGPAHVVRGDTDVRRDTVPEQGRRGLVFTCRLENHAPLHNVIFVKGPACGDNDVLGVGPPACIRIRTVAMRTSDCIKPETLLLQSAGISIPKPLPDVIHRRKPTLNLRSSSSRTCHACPRLTGLCPCCGPTPDSTPQSQNMKQHVAHVVLYPKP